MSPQSKSPEKNILVLFLFTLTLSVLGLPYVRYAVYIMPFFALGLWLIGRPHRLVLNRENTPFILLFVLSLGSLMSWDFNVFKKIYFIYVFLSVFLLFDFSRSELNLKQVGFYIIALGLVNGAMRSGGGGIDDFSIVDSQSALETTFAFPVSLLAMYFFTKKKYFVSLVFTIFVIIFLKRVALLALLSGVIIWLTPIRIRRFILSPWVVTPTILLVVVLSIEFAYGSFDSLIFSIFEKAPNDISKGRQVLWESALNAVSFNYWDYLFSGVGLGKVVSELQTTLRVDKALLHNDLLSLVLEIGIIPFTLFVILLTRGKYLDQRLMSLILLILFSTDNVMIYQHVMFVYLVLQGQLLFGHSGEKKNNSLVK